MTRCRGSLRSVNAEQRRSVRQGESNMGHTIHNVGAAKHIGRYSDAIETESGLRWLFTSGTPGVADDGKIPPGIEAQSRLAWKYIVAALEEAKMTTGDLVKVTTSLTNAADIPAYVKVRGEFLGDVRPAFMLQIVTQLIKPEVLVEVEAIAARK
jgi:2-iminobutanoate/2-iminopropanoate deaminase